MKNLSLKSLAFLLILTIVSSGFPPITAKAANITKSIYVALGDSLTDFATYNGKPWTSYPAYVEQKVESSKNVDLIVINDAIGGYTADDVIHQLKVNSATIEHVKNADFVTVNIGGNDFISLIQSSMQSVGCDFFSYLSSPTKIGRNDVLYNAVYDAMNNKNNVLHKQYITSLENKISEIVSIIKNYNPECFIGLTTLGYSSLDCLGITSIVSKDLLTSIYLSNGYKSCNDEMQKYFKTTANTDPKVYYINLNALCSAKYFQYDDNGNFVDFHPNYDGQIKMANCFINDFWNKVKFRESNNDYIYVSPDSYYSFYPVSSNDFSPANASLGDINVLKIDSTGVGSKGYCNTSTSKRSFEVDLKPCKASGVITGLSFWDTSNASEVLLRFEGTNTTNLLVCAGGNGNYVSQYLRLDFDASQNEHHYKISFNENFVNIVVDGKNIGSIDISKVASPVSSVNPIIFIQKADWVGIFRNTEASSTFAYLK